MNISKHQSTKQGMDDWRKKWEKQHPYVLVGDMDSVAKTVSYHKNRHDALEWVRNNPACKWDYSKLRIIHDKSIFYI